LSESELQKRLSSYDLLTPAEQALVCDSLNAKVTKLLDQIKTEADHKVLQEHTNTLALYIGWAATLGIIVNVTFSPAKEIESPAVAEPDLGSLVPEDARNLNLLRHYDLAALSAGFSEQQQSGGAESDKTKGLAEAALAEIDISPQDFLKNNGIRVETPVAILIVNKMFGSIDLLVISLLDLNNANLRPLVAYLCHQAQVDEKRLLEVLASYRELFVAWAENPGNKDLFPNASSQLLDSVEPGKPETSLVVLQRLQDALINTKNRGLNVYQLLREILETSKATETRNHLAGLSLVLQGMQTDQNLQQKFAKTLQDKKLSRQ